MPKSRKKKGEEELPEEPKAAEQEQPAAKVHDIAESASAQSNESFDDDAKVIYSPMKIHSANGRTKVAPMRRPIMAEYRFTDDEILKLADELTEQHDELSHLTEQMRNQVEQKKNEMSTVRSRINELVRMIRSKTQTREFFCEAECDFDLKVKRWRDVKTGDIKKVEELSASDYQLKMRLDNNIDENIDSNKDNDKDAAGTEETESESEQGSGEGQENPVLETAGVD